MVSVTRKQPTTNKQKPTSFSVKAFDFVQGLPQFLCVKVNHKMKAKVVNVFCLPSALLGTGPRKIKDASCEGKHGLP